MYDDEPPGGPSPLGSGTTWDRLTALEPALKDLECDLRAAAFMQVRLGGDLQIDKIWHDRRTGFKQRLGVLVGWHADHPVLCTEDAYDAAYQHLWGVLENFSSAMGRVGC